MNISIFSTDCACSRKFANQTTNNNPTFRDARSLPARTISNDLTSPPTFKSPNGSFQFKYRSLSYSSSIPKLKKKRPGKIIRNSKFHIYIIYKICHFFIKKNKKTVDQKTLHNRPQNTLWANRVKSLLSNILPKLLPLTYQVKFARIL